MGYERITTIFDGIAIPEEINLRDVLDDFIEKTSIKVEAFDRCIAYRNISFHELDGDWLYEYLSDMGYIICDEYMFGVDCSDTEESMDVAESLGYTIPRDQIDLSELNELP